jgi:hypothetical protein
MLFVDSFITNELSCISIINNYHVNCTQYIARMHVRAHMCMCARVHAQGRIFKTRHWNLLCSNIHIMLVISQQNMTCGSAEMYKQQDQWAVQSTSIHQSHLYVWSTHTECSQCATSELTLTFFFHSHQASCVCKVFLTHNPQCASGHTLLITSSVTLSLRHTPYCIDLYPTAYGCLNIRSYMSPFKNTSTHTHMVYYMHFIWSSQTEEKSLMNYKNIPK